MTFIDTNIASNIEDTPVSKEQELAKAREAVAGTVPLLPSAPALIFDLQRGFLYGEKWQTEIEIRELTGVDEEALARFKTQSDFLDGVLVYGTVRIGSINLTEKDFPERQSILAQLLIGERESLFIKIAGATYGDAKEINTHCPLPNCGAAIEATISLENDIDIPRMETPHTSAYSFTTAKGDVIEYRLATGADQMGLLKKKGATLAEQNTFILSEVMTKYNDEPILNKRQTALALAMGDRQRLLTDIVEHQPAPDLTFLVACPECTWTGEVDLAPGDIFRP